MGLESKPDNIANYYSELGDLLSSPSEPVTQYAQTFEHAKNADVSLEWRNQAVCRGLTALFFAHVGEASSQKNLREAKAKTVCDNCPVKIQCRKEARENREYGYWGGESEEERRIKGVKPSASTNFSTR